MKKLIITFLLLTCALATCSVAHAAIFTGGSGSGWSYSQAAPVMYQGGSGKGDSMVAMSSAAAVGYTTATKLAFSTSPSNVYAGVAFTTQPVVAVQDTYSNTVLTATNTVTLSINNDPPTGSTLGGTTSMPAVAGVADFSGKGVYVSRAGTGFTLQAAASGLTSKTSSAFNILSPILVTSPNGAEVWTVSTANNITWSTYGSLASGTNTVQYSLNNGSTWTTLSTNATSPLSWVTPSAASTQALVRVTNSADSTYTDTSDAVFSLLAGFTMIAPNGGETWANGFAHTISWSTSGTVANVKLEYSADGGSTYNTIIASTANNNQYSWTPGVSSGGANYKLRVSDASNSNSKAISASAFTIQKVAVTAPTLGQRIQVGTSANINWSSAGINNVKIEYSTDSGTTWNTIIASTPASSGTYSWSVPSNFTTSTNVTVRVSSTTADSDNDTAYVISSAFTIYGSLTLTVPNGTDQWAANSSHNITWTTGSGTITNVKLEYSADNFVSDLHTIIASTANNNQYSWTPTTTGTTFKVRVSDAQDSQTSSTSANYFSVTGIGITAPASGATWNCGSSQTITWNYTGSFNYVKIEYSTDSSATWSTIIASAPNTGTYAWTVANTPTNAAQIRISNASDPTTSGTSQTFNIKSVLAITAPNGGETLNVGSSSNITWTATGTVSNVKLEYSSNNGSTWSTIIASTSNTGSYSWTVADAITSSALVKITDVDSGHPASSAQSAAVFTIQSNMAITAPASATNWAVAEAHNITWTNTGTVGQIRLYYATSKDNYIAWTEITSGATTNSNTYSWTVPDIILAVGNDPQANPTLAVKVKVVDASSGHPATTITSNVFNVIYYTITFTVRDSQTQSDLAGLSVSCSSGWSASNLASGVSTTHNYHYGTYTTIWSKTNYSDSSYANWTADSSKTLSLTMTLASVAGQEYHVYSNFTYDYTGDSFLINSWIEKSGTIVTGPTSCTVAMYDANGNVIDINGPNNPGTDLTSTSPNANGVFRLNWDLTNINRNTSYFGKVQIVNQGVTYSSNVTYAISVPAVSTVQQVTSLASQVSDIQASVGTGLNTAVSAIQSSVGSNLSTQVSNLQTDITSVKTSVGADQGTTLYSKVSDILTNTGTNIPATIVSELKKGLRSKILNRPTTVNTGDTVSIRYKTDSGLSPVITVYDANNTARVSSAVMTEIGTTGVYNYDVAFNSAWGTGDYTIICSESTTNSADSMIVHVGTAGGLAGIEAQINTLTTALSTVNTNLSAIKNIVGTTSDTLSSNTLFGKLSGVSTNVSTIASNWGSYKASDIIVYLNTVEGYLGGPNDACGLLTVFGKINCVYNQTTDVSTAVTLANNAYTEVQQLRKEIDFNGKSDTAYSLVKNINDAVTEIKKSVVNIPAETAETKIKEVAESLKETKDMLKKAATEAGLKGGSAKEEVKKGPATLEGLQSQLLELKAMTEVIKKAEESKQEPVVKTWFEPAEKKTEKNK